MRTKLNDELIEDVSLYLEKGMSVQGACGLIGVTYSTFLRWMGRGAEGEEPFATFLERVEEARAKAEWSHVQTIDKARTLPPGEIDWKASQFWLQTARREHGWGQTVRQEVTGADGGPVKVEEAGASLRSKLASLAAAGGEGDDST